MHSSPALKQPRLRKILPSHTSMIPTPEEGRFFGECYSCCKWGHSYKHCPQKSEKNITIQKPDPLPFAVWVIWSASSDNHQGVYSVAHDEERALKQWDHFISHFGYGDPENRPTFSSTNNMRRPMDSLGFLIKAYENPEYDLFTYGYLYKFPVSEPFDQLPRFWVVYMSNLEKKSIEFAGVLAVHSDCSQALKFAQNSFNWIQGKPLQDDITELQDWAREASDSSVMIPIANRHNIVIQCVYAGTPVGGGPYNGHNKIKSISWQTFDLRWRKWQTREEFFQKRAIAFLLSWNGPPELATAIVEWFVLMLQDEILKWVRLAQYINKSKKQKKFMRNRK